MKNIVLLALIALAGCTAAEMPNSSNRGVEEYTICTKGDMNGYSVDERDIIEGRTKGANYKRLLFLNGETEFMTRHAYDVDKITKDGVYTVHVWYQSEGKELYDNVRRLQYDRIYSKPGDYFTIFPSRNEDDNYEHNDMHCEHIHFNVSAVRLFDKKEAEEYIASHPDMKIFNLS
jgi:hypothetical protein